MHRLRPSGMVAPPYYRRLLKRKKLDHWLFEEFPNAGDQTGDGPRLYDYYKISEIVKKLPTIMEKINFVTPYERQWNPYEKKWHREHLQPLHATRKAWSVPPWPLYFDTLDFYKYITKSRLLTDEDANLCFNEYYNSNNVSTESINLFEKRLSELLISSFDSNNEKSDVSNLLKLLAEDAYFTLAQKSENPNLQTIRLSHASRCESFWVRSGFKKMYTRLNVYTNSVENINGRFSCDDRRRLGELSFTMRDILAAQVRCEKPIKNIFEWSETEKLVAPVFTQDINVENDVLFSPKVFNLWPDDGILWQCPGYDADVAETHKFGCVAFKSTNKLNELMNFWAPDNETELLEIKKEFYISTGLTTLFNWLNGQAHCLGFTQFNDIESPLTSQLILSNGKEICFAIGQLNTIAINIDAEGFINNNTNLCCIEGPFNIYDEYDAKTKNFKYYFDGNRNELRDGLNPKILKRILQLCNNC